MYAAQSGPFGSVRKTTCTHCTLVPCFLMVCARTHWVSATAPRPSAWVADECGECPVNYPSISRSLGGRSFDWFRYAMP